MADVIKNQSTLQMEVGFEDNDTRTFTIDSPNTALNLGACVASLGSFMKTNNVLIGDQTGADCKGINSARLINQRTVYLDLDE